MNLKRCDNDHFYDGEKFQNCPHCVVIGGSTNATMPYADMGNMGNMGGGYGSTEVTEPMTVPMSSYAPEPPAAPAPAPSFASEPQMENISLKDAVSKAITAPNEMKDEEKTISIYQAKTGIDPVAGWLVCIEGEDFGGSFTIKSGKNFIGRAANMDIVLHGDNSISREKHAIILYEPKRREFIAHAGESRELFYLNDEVVLNPVRLNQYDILTIGNTRLMFFPCCSEKFSWDNFKKEEG